MSKSLGKNAQLKEVRRRHLILLLISHDGNKYSKWSFLPFVSYIDFGANYMIRVRFFIPQTLMELKLEDEPTRQIELQTS